MGEEKTSVNLAGAPTKDRMEARFRSMDYQRAVEFLVVVRKMGRGIDWVMPQIVHQNLSPGAVTNH
ncbi:hypothetical protein [Desulforhopalus singaporensis]|uniref:Uncharacterized protein n=1 Tax=Desulforhopalus singaporensis TaxID=91360 RepID=A0A1H0TCS7_9BACT|nr:hypothetical protein [Desulforhopalus singaporensis]SDP51853.1 hypothetical protein SAMN05660330_03034 [Desulforhopalus singaporensis]